MEYSERTVRVMVPPTLVNCDRREEDTREDMIHEERVWSSLGPKLAGVVDWACSGELEMHAGN